MGAAARIRAWRPRIAGVAEVLHAHFPSHAYPRHTHSTWTLMVVDSGAIGFELGRRDRGAMPSMVTLLPPHVPHDGHNATAAGFTKRVIYLEEDVLGAERIGPAVDRPGWGDRALIAAVRGLDDALARPQDGFEAESRLAVVTDALRARLDGRPELVARSGVHATQLSSPRDRTLARQVRAVLDDRLDREVVLAEMAVELGAHASHLVRAFSREYGIAPYRYLTGRRLDQARRLLLSGRPPAEVADAVGFYDQAHLTRHFRRLLGTTPAAYARSVRDG